MLQIGNKYYIQAETLQGLISVADNIHQIDLAKKLDKTIWQGLWRNRKGASSWQHITDPKKKSKRLIDIETIPASTLEKYNLPTVEGLKKLAAAKSKELAVKAKAQTDSSLPLHIEKFQDIADFSVLRFKFNLDAARANDLAIAASIVRFLCHYQTKLGEEGKNNGTIHIGYESKAALRLSVIEYIAGKKLYGFDISNPRVLFEKEKAWSKAIQQAFKEHSNLKKIDLEKVAREYALRTLVPNYFGLKNRQVIGRREDDSDIIVGDYNIKEWHAAQVLYNYMNPGVGNKLDYEEVYVRYEMACRKASKEPVSLSSVKRFLSNTAIKEFAMWERSGFAELDKYLPHVSGKRATYSLAKGGYDGFSVDFKTATDKGVVMLTVVAVFDYMSEAITGYDIGYVENGKMVRNMYRNHLNLTGGRSYYEIESDRFSGNLAKDTQEIFAYCCNIISMPAPNDPRKKAPNPKSRFAERYLPELNRLAQSFPGWKGTNITSIDKNRKPNPDYSDSNFVQTYEEGVQQIIKLINIYNNQSLKKFGGKSRMEMCLNNISEKAPVIDPLLQAVYLNQFTITTVRHHIVKITRGSKPNQEVHEWKWEDADLYAHKMNKGNRVAAYFDENDMDMVSLYSFDEKEPNNKDKHIFIHAIDKKLVRAQRAKAEQTDVDIKEIGKQHSYRKKVVERKNRKQLEFEAAIYGIDISNMSLELAEQLVLGARATQKDSIILTPEERYAEALATPVAQQQASYYEDRILRENGMQVPETDSETMSLEDKRKAYLRKKFKK